MKIHACFLLFVLFVGCQNKNTESVIIEPDEATFLAGTYKVTGAFILNSPTSFSPLPNDSLFITKVSPTVVKVRYKIKSSIIDSPETELLIVQKKDTDYYLFTVAQGYVRMFYRYDKIELVMADNYYKLQFTKQAPR